MNCPSCKARTTTDWRNGGCSICHLPREAIDDGWKHGMQHPFICAFCGTDLDGGNYQFCAKMGRLAVTIPLCESCWGRTGLS